MNRLDQEKSAYLRHAAKQKINWYPWSEEAFEKARNEGKPVFLSSGAIWCHWCHVMAKESFEDDEVAMLLNEHYVAIKLDRDERPDVDRRYQQAVTVMGVGGGWPLNVFLTPDKVPFYGGTYFPVTDSFGKPGFKTLLKALSDLYTTKKEEVYESSRKFHDFLKQQSPRKGKASEVLINEAVKNIMKAFDKTHGGFGTAPKFPMSGAMEFLLNRYFFTKDQAIEGVIKKTLMAMASGGFHDQLGGGFHRYSTDEAWVIPHFEKMTEDNAWLLRNYTDAYSLFGDEFFRKIAENIIFFTRTGLSRPDGGFYASMDADVTPEDEGGYFTWTDEELHDILTSDEYSVFSLYFIHERNAMHHDRKKFVLSVSMGIDDIGRRLNIAVDTVKDKLATARQKLLTERNKRQKPFVDSVLYTSLNGMMVAAYLKAYKAFDDEKLKEFALNSLESTLRINVENGRLLHCQGVKAFLDDYICIIDALISAYDTSANTEYLTLADGFMSDCLEHFWDREGGGFFDTDEEVIGLRLKNIEDIPRPSANALAVTVLLKLALILNKEEYRQYADILLNTFSTDAQLLQVHGAYFFCGLDAFYHTLKLDITAPYDSALAKAALHTYHPYSCLVYGEPDKDSVIPCVGDTCYAPIKDPDKLSQYIKSSSFKCIDKTG